MRQPKFEYFESESRSRFVKARWYWRLKAGNGKIICQSEGYNTKRACLHGIGAVQSAVLDANVIYVDFKTGHVTKSGIKSWVRGTLLKEVKS